MAPNAFAQGQELFATQQRRRAVDNALAAMIQRYGPEAADPDTLAAMERIEQERQLFPYQMRGVQRVDAAQNAAVAAAGPLAGDPSAQTAVANQNTRQRQAGLSAALMLQSTARRNGDLGATFDRLQTVLPALGIPAEQLAPIREQLVNDPEYVNDLVTMLRTGEGADELIRRAVGNPVAVYDENGQLRYMQNYNIGEPELIKGVTPAGAAQAADRVEQGYIRLGQSRERINMDELKRLGFEAPPGTVLEQLPDGQVVARFIQGTPQEIDQQGVLAERVGKLNTSIAGLQTADDIAKSGITAIDDALKIANGLNDGVLSTILRAGLARAVPGSQAAQLQGFIKEVSGKSMIDALQNIDASLAPMSDTDVRVLESAYGAISITQDPAILRRNLQAIKEVYQRALERSEQMRVRARTELERAQTTRQNLTRPASAPPPADAPLEDLLNYYTP